MSTYTVNIIHKKWYSLQSFMHINLKTKVTDIVIVISIIVAVKCHTHPTFPKWHKSHTEPAAASIQMQASQRQVAQATESDQQLASQKNSKAIPATNDVKSYFQLLYTRFSYSIAVQCSVIARKHNHTHFSGYSSAVTCNVCHFVITTAIETRGKPYTNNRNQIKHIINSSSPPDLRPHTH